MTALSARILILLSMLTVFPEAHAEDSLVPGPYLEKRKEISAYLDKARKIGVGVKPYEEALKQIEVQIQDGATSEDIKKEVSKLIESLREQDGNSRTLKSPAYHPAQAHSAPASTAGTRETVVVQTAELETLLFTLINRHRSEAGLPTLRPSSSLAQIARAHAQDMCKRRFFAHVNPDGLDSQGRARAAGYMEPVRENINYTSFRQDGITTIEAADKSLFNSPGHKANMLHTEVSVGGVGVVFDSHGGLIYVCELFSQE